MAGQHGGARPGAGKPRGAKTKATIAQKATFAELAKKYAPDALETLKSVMTSSQSDSARVAAANSIIDRAYGRVPTAPDGDEAEAPSQTININTAAPIGEIRVTRSDT